MGWKIELDLETECLITKLPDHTQDVKKDQDTVNKGTLRSNSTVKEASFLLEYGVQYHTS